MRKIISSIITFFIIVSLTAFSCSKEDSTPIEPPTHGAIKGTVTESGTGNVLEGANVFSVPPSSFVKTDASGRYQITTVEPGDYAVKAGKSGYDTLLVNVSVVAGADAVADFVLTKSDTNKNKNYGQIAGTIINSKTFVPIENVNLTSTPVTSSITSDAFGKYVFVNVIPGQYVIKSEKIGFDTTSINVNVVVGQITNADIYLTETDTTVPPTTGVIVGTVVDAQSSIVISGASVSTNPATSTVFTKDDGTYSFSNILPGDYSVSVTKLGFQEASAQITVVAGNESRADFTMITSTGSITGTVTDDSTHLPITGVNIQTQPGTSSITTDSLGKFTFSNVPPASYTISAKASGYSDATLSVVVTAGNITQADISMIANK